MTERDSSKFRHGLQWGHDTVCAIDKFERSSWRRTSSQFNIIKKVGGAGVITVFTFPTIWTTAQFYHILKDLNGTVDEFCGLCDNDDYFPLLLPFNNCLPFFIRIRFFRSLVAPCILSSLPVLNALMFLIFHHLCTRKRRQVSFYLAIFDELSFSVLLWFLEDDAPKTKGPSSDKLEDVQHLLYPFSLGGGLELRKLVLDVCLI